MTLHQILRTENVNRRRDDDEQNGRPQAQKTSSLQGARDILRYRQPRHGLLSIANLRSLWKGAKMSRLYIAQQFDEWRLLSTMLHPHSIDGGHDWALLRPPTNSPHGWPHPRRRERHIGRNARLFVNGNQEARVGFADLIRVRCRDRRRRQNITPPRSAMSLTE